MFSLLEITIEECTNIQVIKKKAWRDIAKELNLPASITSAAFTMRSQYVYIKCMYIEVFRDKHRPFTGYIACVNFNALMNIALFE